jgi:hypothetical protein
MKNISLIIFVLFNYFFIQKFFEQKNVNINSESNYQKTFNESIDNKSQIIFKNNIMDDKTEIIYLY